MGFRHRIIVTLLIQGEKLVKGVRYRDHVYVGDPMNAVRIFNEKEVDEIIFLDISAGDEGRTIDPYFLERVAEESYAPFTAGGGIKTVEDARKVLFAGAEKVSLNSALYENPGIVEELASRFGKQSVVVSVDVKRNFLSRPGIYFKNGRKKGKGNLVEFCSDLEQRGAGEILLNCIHRDGTMEGYDLELIKSVAENVNIPVIASCGAGSLEDLSAALKSGAAAVAAGSLFVFQGKMRGVLLNYPEPSLRRKIAFAKE